MNRLWTVGLTALLVVSPALAAVALLSRHYESARCSGVADNSVDNCFAGYSRQATRRKATRTYTSAPVAPAIAKPERRADNLWRAICEVESGGDPNAYNAREGAAGIAQIRTIYMADANRILDYKRFKLSDRYNPAKSKEMFDVVVGRYGRIGTDEEAARIHNGGPRGMQKAATLKYWEKVKAEMERVR